MKCCAFPLLLLLRTRLFRICSIPCPDSWYLACVVVKEELKKKHTHKHTHTPFNDLQFQAERCLTYYKKNTFERIVFARISAVRALCER